MANKGTSRAMQRILHGTMEQVSAVEWLENEIGLNNMGDFLKDKIKQAKEIEKAELEKLKDFDTWKEWKNRQQQNGLIVKLKD